MRLFCSLVPAFATLVVSLAYAQAWPCETTDPLWIARGASAAQHGAILMDGPCPAPCDMVEPPPGFRVLRGNEELKGQIVEWGPAPAGAYGPGRAWFAWKPEDVPSVGDTLTVWFDEQTWWYIEVAADEGAQAQVTGASLDEGLVFFGEMVCCEGEADSCGKSPCFAREQRPRDTIVFSIEGRPSHVYRTIWTSPDSETATDDFSIADTVFHTFDNPSSEYCYRVEERLAAGAATQVIARDCMKPPPGRSYEPVPNESTKLEVLVACKAPPPGYEEDFCDLYEGRCTTESDLPGCSFAFSMCGFAPSQPDAGPVAIDNTDNAGDTPNTPPPDTTNAPPAARESSDGCSVVARSEAGPSAWWYWMIASSLGWRCARRRRYDLARGAERARHGPRNQ